MSAADRLVIEHLAADALDARAAAGDYRELAHAALDRLHEQQREMGRLRQRIADLIDDLRRLRGATREAA